MQEIIIPNQPIAQDIKVNSDLYDFSSVYDKVRNATVGIEVTHYYSPYLGSYKTEWIGTGFVINKEKGWILTNKHIIKRENIAEQKVKFVNGAKYNASLVYDDLLHDFAIIKVDSQSIPDFIEELKFNTNDIMVFQHVFMIGFNGGLNFAQQDGIITDLNQIKGQFSTQQVTISLNSKGGSSGSAVCNKKGEVVALNFAGNDISASAIPIIYITEKLAELEQGLIPTSKSLGALFKDCNLDNMVEFASFPLEKQKIYMELFSKAQNTIICIDKIIPNTPADGKLQPGDVLWEINGESVNNLLYPIMHIINQATSELCIKLYRDGELKEVNITPYDLRLHSIKKMVIYENLAFFEGDELSFLKKGVTPGKVFTSLSIGGSLNDLQKSVIEKLGKFYINDIDSLISALPHLIKEKKFIAHTKNLSPSMMECALESPAICKNADNQELNMVTLDPYASNYLIFSFNESSMQWNQLPSSLIEEHQVELIGNMKEEL